MWFLGDVMGNPTQRILKRYLWALALLFTFCCLPETFSLAQQQSVKSSKPANTKPVLINPVKTVTKTQAAPKKNLPVKTTPKTPPTASFQNRPEMMAPTVVNADLIRVGISDDDMLVYEIPTAKLSANGPFTVADKSSGKLVFQGTGNQLLSFRKDKAGFYFSGTYKTGQSKENGPFAGPMVVQPKEANKTRVTVNHVTRRGKVPNYRGVLEVVQGYSSPNKLVVVNVLPMQDYLKAVVPNELPMKYGVEAVKAQSVAARNYAIRPREKPWPQFDICDSQYCQAYYGSQTESAETSKALADTEGLLALFRGEPILALYSSSHGGYGESYANAFSDPKTNQFPAPVIPYLQGGPDLNEIRQKFGDLSKETQAQRFWRAANVPSYDVQSPHYRWQRRFTRPELEAVLERTLSALSKDKLTAPFVQPTFLPNQKMGDILSLKVKERGVSGKAMAIEVESTTGKWVIEKEFVIRKALAQGGKMLPSANIVIQPEWQTLEEPAEVKPNKSKPQVQRRLESVTLFGGGFGHGVGMSQLGASWMAKHGKTFPDILQHYYQGIAVGSRPIEAGSEKGNLPVQTRFMAQQPHGILYVARSNPASSVKITLNDTAYLLKPEQFHGNRVKVPLASIQPNQLNTLTLYPDSQRLAKAWIELYPAK